MSAVASTIDSWRPPAIPTLIGLGFAGAAAVMTVALPLLTYTTSLALFGIAHVLSELHYIDRRFAGRLDAGVAWGIGAPIALAVAAVAAGYIGLLPPRLTVTIELAAAVMLVAGALALMRRRRVIGAGAGLLLAAGAIAAPFQLLLALAILHNLTPLGFFAEALPGTVRRRALTLAAIPLIGLPLLIATGLPFELLARLGLTLPEARFLASGPLTLNLGVYVPAGLVSTDWALHAFSAAVFAQIMHYAAVIGLLPRLLDTTSTRPVAPWPRGRWLVAGIAAMAGAFALAFVVDFRLARQIYGMAALAHGWIEIPILLIAWGGGFTAAQPVKA
jgi:hypothetical protein